MKFAVSYNIDWEGTALVVYGKSHPWRDRTWRTSGEALVAGVFPDPPRADDSSLVPPDVVDAAVARARADRGAATTASPARRLEKFVSFAGAPMRVACDGVCSKAWGIDLRPSVQTGDGVTFDGVAWLADGELGEAPADPGTREGDQGKPTRVTDPAVMNRWCVRQCERCVGTPYGAPDAPLTLRDFSQRAWAWRELATDSEESQEEAATSLTPWATEEVEAVLGELDGVARALMDAPARAASSAQAHLRQPLSRPEDRQPWQIGSLEQICRNQAGEARALARRLRHALGLSPRAIDAAATKDAYARDERD